MTRNPVKSSNIRSVGYDEAAQVLHVEFPGGVYEAKGVTPESYKSMMGDGAEDHSIGKAFNAHIRGKHEVTKL